MNDSRGSKRGTKYLFISGGMKWVKRKRFFIENRSPSTYTKPGGKTALAFRFDVSTSKLIFPRTVAEKPNNSPRWAAYGCKSPVGDASFEICPYVFRPSGAFGMSRSIKPPYRETGARWLPIFLTIEYIAPTIYHFRPQILIGDS